MNRSSPVPHETQSGTVPHKGLCQSLLPTAAPFPLTLLPCASGTAPETFRRHHHLLPGVPVPPGLARAGSCAPCPCPALCIANQLPGDCQAAPVVTILLLHLAHLLYLGRTSLNDFQQGPANPSLLSWWFQPPIDLCPRDLDFSVYFTVHNSCCKTAAVQVSYNLKSSLSSIQQNQDLMSVYFWNFGKDKTAGFVFKLIAEFHEEVSLLFRNN